MVKFLKVSLILFNSYLLISLHCQATELAKSPKNNSFAVTKVKELDFSESKQAALIHLLKQDCGSCHGMTLKGGLGPALLPENIKNKPLLLLKNTILYGRSGTAMPPWQTILSKDEALWISMQLQQGLKHE